MDEPFVRRRDWWDCLVVGQAGSGIAARALRRLRDGELADEGPVERPVEELLGGDGGQVLHGMRRLQLRSAQIAWVGGEGRAALSIDLGAKRALRVLPGPLPAAGGDDAPLDEAVQPVERPEWLPPLPPRPSAATPRLPAEQYRPVLLHSRWLHCEASEWAMPLLREASVRGLPGSLSLGAQLEPGGALREHVRYADTVFVRIPDGGGAREARALGEALRGAELQHLLALLPNGDCALREAGRGSTLLELVRSEDEPLAPPSDASLHALIAGYVAARRLGRKVASAALWGALAARSVSAAGVDGPAAWPERGALEAGLQRRLVSPRPF